MMPARACFTHSRLSTLLTTAHGRAEGEWRGPGRLGYTCTMFALKHRPPLQDAPIEAATQRLHAAIDALTDAIDRRREADRHQEALLAQLHAMGNDRARLAAELDGAKAEVGEVEQAGREVMRRLDVAMGTIRDVLATHGG